MVKSMTGYGRAVETIGSFTVTVEIKSVNHRYFEFSPKVYRAYSFLEEKLKSFVQQYISRGKVDCYIQIENEATDECIVKVNHSLAAGYINAFREIAETYSIDAGNIFENLISKGDIFSVHKNETDEDALWDAVSQVLKKAIDSFISMREIEGEKLMKDIFNRADSILENVAFIEERSPQTVTEYNDKLRKRIRELIEDANVDEQRLLTEAAIFADKIAVAEETVRLRSHIEQLHSFFELDRPIGRDLDFLIQEINRETNTIGSKASDLEIARRVISIKSDIEKIREQVQNIE